MLKRDNSNLFGVECLNFLYKFNNIIKNKFKKKIIKKQEKNNNFNI